MTLEKKDPKPHATIEGSAEDITPKADETISPKAAQAELGKADGSADDPAAEKPGKQPPVQKASTLQGLGGAFAAAVAGSAATLVVLALATSFDGPPRAWLSRLTGAETAIRLAEKSTADVKASEAKLAAILGERKAEITALQSTMVAVGDRLGKLEGLPQRVTTLGERLSDLGDLGELPAQTTALGLRIGAAETRLDTLTRKSAARTQTVDSLAKAIDESAKAGTSSAAVSTGMARTISRLEKAEADLAGLAHEVEKLNAAPAPDDAWRDGTNTALAVLRRDVDGLTSRLATQRQVAVTARLGSQLDELKSAIAAGQPFGDLLEDFNPSPALTVLTKYSANGVATLEALRNGLEGLVVEATKPAGASGTLDRIVGLFGGAVKIRRIDDKASTAGPLAMAAKALEAGDVARAMEIVSQVEQNTHTEAWLNTARPRAEVNAAFAELEAAPGDGVRH